jgi:CHASE3 domain sensor protein
VLAEIRATNHVSLTSVPDVTQTTAPLRLWSRAPGVILSRSMQRSAARLTLLASLVVGGMLAASFLWIVERRSDESVATQADISIRLARMSETVAGIGAAQRSYVAPGQLDQPWFDQASALLDQLSIDIEQAPSRLRSPGAAEAIAALADSADALIAADERTRQNLGIGQDLMASDVIFSDGHNMVDTMTAGLRDLQAAEQGAHQTRLASLTRQRWAAFGAAAVLWVVGLLLLAKPSAIPLAAIVEPTQTRPSDPAGPLEAHDSHPEQGVPLDLTLVAGLCTDLSRVTSPSALPDLLGRTAQVLDASGVILWISAGEQLFPVMGHGYAPDVLARMTPIERDGDNAAADAWRTGRLTVVHSAGPSDNGAIVAPLLGLDDCVGVLAAEVRHGVADRPAVHALATVIAAQLATVVPAWPPASLTNPDDASSVGTPSGIPSAMPTDAKSTSPNAEAPNSPQASPETTAQTTEQTTEQTQTLKVRSA